MLAKSESQNGQNPSPAPQQQPKITESSRMINNNQNYDVSNINFYYQGSTPSQINQPNFTKKEQVVNLNTPTIWINAETRPSFQGESMRGSYTPSTTTLNVPARKSFVIEKYSQGQTSFSNLPSSIFVDHQPNKSITNEYPTETQINNSFNGNQMNKQTTQVTAHYSTHPIRTSYSARKINNAFDSWTDQGQRTLNVKQEFDRIQNGSGFVTESHKLKYVQPVSNQNNGTLAQPNVQTSTMNAWNDSPKNAEEKMPQVSKELLLSQNEAKPYTMGGKQTTCGQSTQVACESTPEKANQCTKAQEFPQECKAESKTYQNSFDDVNKMREGLCSETNTCGQNALDKNEYSIFVTPAVQEKADETQGNTKATEGQQANDDPSDKQSDDGDKPVKYSLSQSGFAYQTLNAEKANTYHFFPENRTNLRVKAPTRMLGDSNLNTFNSSLLNPDRRYSFMTSNRDMPLGSDMRGFLPNSRIVKVTETKREATTTPAQIVHSIPETGLLERRESKSFYLPSKSLSNMDQKLENVTTADRRISYISQSGIQGAYVQTNNTGNALPVNSDLLIKRYSIYGRRANQN